VLEPYGAQQVPRLQGAQHRDVFFAPEDRGDRNRGREHEELVTRRRRGEAREGPRALLAGRRSIGGGEAWSQRLPPAACIFILLAVIGSNQVH
jgi:hypothetical protein